MFHDYNLATKDPKTDEAAVLSASNCASCGLSGAFSIYRDYLLRLPNIGSAWSAPFYVAGELLSSLSSQAIYQS